MHGNYFMLGPVPVPGAQASAQNSARAWAPAPSLNRALVSICNLELDSFCKPDESTVGK